MDRQDIQIYFVAVRKGRVGVAECIVNDIAVGKHDAFSFSGGSGGEKDHGAVVFRYIRTGGASREFF